MSYSVYIHTNKVNGKRYVGITRQPPKKRFQNGEGYKHSKHFYAAIHKYGWNNFDHYIVEVDTPEQMYELEKQWIEQYQTTNPDKGYNKSLGGEDGGYQGKNCWSKEYIKSYNDNHKQEHKDYYEKHKKDIKIRVKKNYESHREEKKLYLMEYRLKNKEELRIKRKEFYLKHRDEINLKRRLKRKNDLPITPLW